MPIYTYKCCNCKHVQEIKHSMSYETTLFECALCNESVLMEKQIADFNILVPNREKHLGKPRPGKVVEKFIEANREVLEEEKHKHSNVDYEE